MDRQFMTYALELAAKGGGQVSPNPMVGAVLVKNGGIIGSGWHQTYGGPHAEVNAIGRVAESTNGAELYVTLEPCCHHGKTPPCTDLIIRSGIKKVFVAMEDPNPLVAGKGINQLKEAGLQVQVGMMEDDAKNLNKAFIKYIQQGMPYIIMKSAMSADGKTATRTGHAKWISNESSWQLVHELRHRTTGIMVGIGTVMVDDPQLTTRLASGEGVNPIPIIIDAKGQIPTDAKLFSPGLHKEVYLAVGEEVDMSHLTAACPQVILLPMPLKNGHMNLSRLMKSLAEKGIDSILLEGGSELNASALSHGIVDEIMTFIAPMIIGGHDAKTPVGGLGPSTVSEAIPLKLLESQRLGDDMMFRWKVGG